MNPRKLLVVRFSSFGDVTQTLSVIGHLHKHFPKAELHWLTREDMKPLTEGHPGLTKVWTLSRKKGFLELHRLALRLRNEDFDAIYDAHNNLRSLIFGMYLRLFKSVVFLRRPIYRWKRFLLFRFRKNFFEMPFSGQRDLLKPLEKWGLSFALPETPQIFFSDENLKKVQALDSLCTKKFVVLAPSAAFFLKRWPEKYWVELIKLFPQENFILVGGPEDRFINNISNLFDPKRVFNAAGLCDLGMTVALVSQAKAVVSNDTGVLHVAEQLGKKTIALMGPAPFGFPSRPSTIILQKNLSCRPCSKHGQGPCVNIEHHACLVNISPSEVQNKLTEILL